MVLMPHNLAKAWVLLCFAVLAQCTASAFAVSIQNPFEQQTGTSALRVIVLTPDVLIERSYMTIDYRGLKTDGLPKGIPPSQVYQSALLEQANRAISRRFTAIEEVTLPPDARDICEKLSSLTSRLSRGSLSDEALLELARLRTHDQHEAVFAQSFRLELSGTWTWNTIIQAALVSADGRVIWAGSKEIRDKTLAPGHPQFDKALDSLYADFGRLPRGAK